MNKVYVRNTISFVLLVICCLLAQGAFAEEALCALPDPFDYIAGLMQVFEANGLKLRDYQVVPAGGQGQADLIALLELGEHSSMQLHFDEARTGTQYVAMTRYPLDAGDKEAGVRAMAEENNRLLYGALAALYPSLSVEDTTTLLQTLLDSRAVISGGYTLTLRIYETPVADRVWLHSVLYITGEGAAR